MSLFRCSLAGFLVRGIVLELSLRVSEDSVLTRCLETLSTGF